MCLVLCQWRKCEDSIKTLQRSMSKTLIIALIHFMIQSACSFKKTNFNLQQNSVGVYIHTCILYRDIHTYLHIYIHIRIYMYLHTHIYTYIHTSKRMKYKTYEGHTAVWNLTHLNVIWTLLSLNFFIYK